MSARSRTAALEDAEAEAAYLRFVMCDAATLSAYPLASAMFAVRFHAKVHAAMVVLHERGAWPVGPAVLVRTGGDRDLHCPQAARETLPDLSG